MRMASCYDFLCQDAPIRERYLRVAVIVQAIVSTAFFTVQGTAGIKHQPDPGRTTADFYCFRVHASDPSTAARRRRNSELEHYFPKVGRPNRLYRTRLIV